MEGFEGELGVLGCGISTSGDGTKDDRLLLVVDPGIAQDLQGQARVLGEGAAGQVGVVGEVGRGGRGLADDAVQAVTVDGLLVDDGLLARFGVDLDLAARVDAILAALTA